MQEVVDNTVLSVILQNLLELGSLILTFVMEYPALAAMFGASLVSVACYAITKVKRTSKH